ncbi:hypothetical protein J6590_088940 [Homalodisca vitripennis]|nr:hypothetical protein J6590_088940 [Homalodisca vitripennis]
MLSRRTSFLSHKRHRNPSQRVQKGSEGGRDISLITLARRIILLALGAVCRLVSCFHQRIIFEGGQEVLLTDSHWKISLRYNLTELQVQGQNLSGLVVEVKEYLDQFYDQLLRDNLSMHSPLPQLEAGFRYEFTGIQQNIK